MCGIAGGVALDLHTPVNGGRVERMSCLIAHRGPDAEGLWTGDSGRVALAHRRLSIIDLASGDQPMRDEGSGMVLVFNGEIYNYRELRTELIAGGEIFSTGSDTEVLLRLLVLEGTDCLERLWGMFAFAAWDPRSRELILARDRLGKKPLYYMVENGCFYFASSFRALRDTSSGGETIELAAVDSFLTLGYIPSPLTMDSRISKLPAGTWLVRREREARVHRYWNPAEVGEPIEGSHEEAVDSLDELLNNAVSIRLRSDVPLGVFLSGGIDSSLVAAIASRQLDEPIRTFSIAFTEKGFDESPYAEEVARRLGSEHRTFQSPYRILELLPEIVRHHGEPFADPASLPTWLLAEKTREHVTVALAGDGGDEGFAGYEWYQTAARLERIAGMPGVRPLAFRGRSLSAGSYAPLDRVLRLGSLLALEEADRFAALRSFVSSTDADYLYAGKLAARRRHQQRNPRTHIANAYARSSGPMLCRMRTADIDTYLADCLLPKVDVATMAHGLEARAPLLDHRVVEFALGLPPEWLWNGSGGKAILKTVLWRYLPEELFARPKQGFSVPLNLWFSNQLRDSLMGLARSERLADSGWFNQSGIGRLVEEHLLEKRDHSQRLYNLLVLDEWLKQN